jgi:hypothetical protein
MSNQPKIRKYDSRWGDDGSLDYNAAEHKAKQLKDSRQWVNIRVRPSLLGRYLVFADRSKLAPRSLPTGFLVTKHGVIRRLK